MNDLSALFTSMCRTVTEIVYFTQLIVLFS
jgi:hypothetical protein